MQKNWYVVYTKANSERKVSSLLSKKGFENFCPLNYKSAKSLFGAKIIYTPLFKSNVFVRTTESEIISLSKRTNGILSLLYLLGKPAIIEENEINAIKEFTHNHREIEVEKLHLNLKNGENVVANISYHLDGKILMIKSNVVKVNLPSLGFTIISKVEGESIMGREMPIEDRKILVQ